MKLSAPQIVGWLNLRLAYGASVDFFLGCRADLYCHDAHGPSIMTLYLSFFLMSMASMGTMRHMDSPGELWFERTIADSRSLWCCLARGWPPC